MIRGGETALCRSLASAELGELQGESVAWLWHVKPNSPSGQRVGTKQTRKVEPPKQRAGSGPGLG